MKLVELTCSIGENGLKIPINALQKMGFTEGDITTVAFLSADGETNSFQEFLIYGNTQAIRIPAELLAQAQIAPEDDVRIACFDGNLLITRAEFQHPEELPELLNRLTRAADLAKEEFE